jgi:transposase
MVDPKISNELIEKYILPHIPLNKRGSKCKFSLHAIIQAIIHKLKTGCQWRCLFFENQGLKPLFSWQTVYRYFRKWSASGVWQKAWYAIREDKQARLDLNILNLDGTQTIAKKGGELVGYQGRKKAMSSNILIVTDKNGLPLAFSAVQNGRHHDQYQLIEEFKEMYQALKPLLANRLNCVLNADKGFDNQKFRRYLFRKKITPNIAENQRNRQKSKPGRKRIFDEGKYRFRFTCERTFAWFDAYRTLLIRHDKSAIHWINWHFIAAFLCFAKC